MNAGSPIFFAGWWPILRILVVGSLARVAFGLLTLLQYGVVREPGGEHSAWRKRKGVSFFTGAAA